MATQTSAKTDRIDSAMQLLEEGIQNLTSTEEWRRWLLVAARLPNYSFSNQLLILAQRPDATKVAGFKTWLALDRAVRKGEKAIYILAPTFPSKDSKKVEGLADVEETAEDGKITRRPMYLRAVPVFALEQTDGDPLPQPIKKLTGDTAGDLFDQLVAYSTARGCPVTVEAISGGANGYFEPLANRIVIH